MSGCSPTSSDRHRSCTRPGRPDNSPSPLQVTNHECREILKKKQTKNKKQKTKKQKQNKKNKQKQHKKQEKPQKQGQVKASKCASLD